MGSVGAEASVAGGGVGSVVTPDCPPPSVMPAANYVPYTVSGNLVFISGTLPMKDGKPQDIGKLGREFTVEFLLRYLLHDVEHHWYDVS